MLELEGLTLTIVCTIIVVTMATWFLCCWRKKDVNVTDGKTNKAKQVSINGSKKEKTEDSSPAADKSGNGEISQSPGPAPQSIVDVGDFSVVQRETEILRSYRKPAPPKNRARQSRAPRAMNRSTENLDIFTELSEDELKSSDENEDNSNEPETTADESIDHISDEADGVKFRTNSQHDSGKRETRSSMLADIEKTLARLHSTEESQVQEKDKPDDLFQDNESSSNKEAGRSSTPSTLNTETHSAHSSPSSKTKAAPKVSPKPIPRKRNTGAKTPEYNSQQDNEALKESSDTKTPENNSQILDNEALKESSDTKTPENNSQILDNEALKESSDTKSDDISDQMTSSLAVTSLAVQLHRSSAADQSTQEICTIINSTVKDKPSDIDLSDTTKCSKSKQEDTHESPQVKTESGASTVAEDGNVNISISSEQVFNETPEGDTQTSSLQDTGHTEQADVSNSTQISDINPENANETENNKTESTANEANTQEIPQANQDSTEQEVQKEQENVAAEHSSIYSSEPQQQPSQENKAETEPNIEKTNESTDDQSAKGKLSKIPIRAGFKKGSTPPLDKGQSTK